MQAYHMMQQCKQTASIDMLAVLVCSGCHSKIPHTEWLKQQKFTFSHFWRFGKFKFKGPADYIPMRSRFLACRCHLLSVCSHGHQVHEHRERKRKLFIKPPIL